MRNKIFIAYRLLRSKEQSRFISLVTLISTIAITIGIAAVIIVLSVMNGFESEIHERILKLNSHITIAFKETQDNNSSLIKVLEGMTEIKHIAQTNEAEGFIKSTSKSSAVLIKSFNSNLRQRDQFQFIESNNIKRSELVIGEVLAQKMKLLVGDTISLTIPNINSGRVSFLNNHSFRIKEIAVFGLQEYDSTLVLMNEKDAIDMMKNIQYSKKIVIDLYDIYEMDKILDNLGFIQIGLDNKISDWTTENAVLFKAINIEKMIMTSLLFFIVLVAMFNVIVMLSMSIDAKKREIAILKTIGFNSLDISHIFFFQGILNVLFGIFSGSLLGVISLWNLDKIERFIDYLFGLNFFPPGLYYINTMPYLIKPNEIYFICGFALIISMLACLIPSMKAGKQKPANITRFHNG